MAEWSTPRKLRREGAEERHMGRSQRGRWCQIHDRRRSSARGRRRHPRAPPKAPPHHHGWTPARPASPPSAVFGSCAAFWKSTVSTVWLYTCILTISGAYKNVRPKTQAHCRVDLIGGAPWISVPYPFQWGAPTFDAGEAFAMMMTSFIAIVESTGALIAASRYASATMIPPSIVSRGIDWQGIGILLDSFFGTANGPSVSVIGASKMNNEWTYFRNSCGEENAEGCRRSFRKARREHAVPRQKLESYLQLLRQAGPARTATRPGGK